MNDKPEKDVKNPSLLKQAWGLIKISFVIFALLLIFLWFKTDGFLPFRISFTGTRASTLHHAVEKFKQHYHALPGDFKDASSLIEGCDNLCAPDQKAGGDGIIGDKDFAKNLFPKKPPSSNETQLFWIHLDKAGLFSGTSLQSLPPIPDVTYEVGYADGRSFPETLIPEQERMKGHILVLFSDQVLAGQAKMNDVGKQPLSPRDAAPIDRKMDDGWANTAYVQGYGPRTCFDMKHPNVKRFNDLKSYGYDETNVSRDCGLIFLIAADDDYKPRKGEYGNPAPSQPPPSSAR